MKTDLAPVKGSTDLVAIAGQTVHLARVSGNNGIEYAGPCPRCGGRDRFRVQGRGLWMCRQCHPKWDDAIGFLRWRDNMSFTEAVSALGGTLPDRTPAPATYDLRETKAPTEGWTASAVEYLARSIIALWDAPGDRARAWLEQRGLTPDTIKRFRLGFQPSDEWAEWGGGRVRLERGIVIPRFLAASDPAPRFFNVRRPVPDVGFDPHVHGPKYRAVAGGQMIALGLDHLQGHPVGFAVEGEFDAMLVAQLAGDLVDVFTTGGAGVSLDTASAARLLTMDRCYVAYDNDDAGRKGAAAALKWSSRMTPASAIPQGNDLTELHRSGGSVRAFVEYHVNPPQTAPKSGIRQHIDLVQRVTRTLVDREGYEPAKAVMFAEGMTDEELTAWLEGYAWANGEAA